MSLSTTAQNHSPSAPGAGGGNQTNANQHHHQSGNAAGLLLDGDGILTQLFYFFWRLKVNAVASAGGGNVTTGTYNPAKPPKSDDPAIQAVMDLCIPSTVILEHNFPKFWYAKSGDFDDGDDVASSNRSSSLSSAPLERRTGRDIDSAAVIRAFRVPEGSSGAQTPATGDIVASYYAEATDEEGRACTRVEFLDVEGVKGLLVRRTRRPDGILQCWVSPSGKSNSVVQVIWSPHVTHVTKRKNRFPLRDTRLALYDRAVTFEGLAHFSDESFVAPHVKTQTKLVCDELVRHFRDVHRVTVTRMVLYFKTDTAGRLWFLFGNSLRTADRRQISLSLRGMKPQERIDAENAQSSRIARMLIDEAYEVKASHQAHSKMEDYATAHKKIRQAAKEEPLIRSLIGTQVPPYANLRPKPPSLGPIGETYWQNPRKNNSGANKKGLQQNDINQQQQGDDVEQQDGVTMMLNNKENTTNDETMMNDPNVNAASSPQSAFSPTAANNNVTISSPFSPANRKSQAVVSMSRLMAKIKTATLLSTSSPARGGDHRQLDFSSPGVGGQNQQQQRDSPTNNNKKSSATMLTSSLACVIPPWFGAAGTLGGGSLSMFSSTTMEPSIGAELERQELDQFKKTFGGKTVDSAANMTSNSPPQTIHLQSTLAMSSTESETAEVGGLKPESSTTSILSSGSTPTSRLKKTVSSVVEDHRNQKLGGSRSSSPTSANNNNTNGRKPQVLWQIVRLAVFTGAVKLIGVRPELREFLKSLMYGIYSHFSTENTTSKMVTGRNKGMTKPFRIVVPRAYFRALGENWWENLGFSRVRVVKVSDVHVLLPPPPSQQRKRNNNNDSGKNSRKLKSGGGSSPSFIMTLNNDDTNTAPRSSASTPPLFVTSSNNNNNNVDINDPPSLATTQQNLAAAISEAMASDGNEDNNNNEQHQHHQEENHDEEEEQDGNRQEKDDDDENDDEAEADAKEDASAAVAAEESYEEEETDPAFKPILYSGSKSVRGGALQQQQQSTNDADSSSTLPTPPPPQRTTTSMPDNVVRLRNKKETTTAVASSSSEPRRPAEVPINSHPDDLVLEVASLATPLLHVQSQMEKLIRKNIDLPAAKLRFYYAAHRVIMERKRARSFASIVKQSLLNHQKEMVK